MILLRPRRSQRQLHRAQIVRRASTAPQNCAARCRFNESTATDILTHNLLAVF
ncbi:hypothetical protein [Chromatium okenii]|uniref:hypothetical protein n=1 Tax=Chromatium okenii TaxID=61644 RepID=UPI001905CA09|nr:hypothetical protein [Chromatium okenii]